MPASFPIKIPGKISKSSDFPCIRHILHAGEVDSSSFSIIGENKCFRISLASTNDNLQWFIFLISMDHTVGIRMLRSYCVTIQIVFLQGFLLIFISFLRHGFSLLQTSKKWSLLLNVLYMSLVFGCWELSQLIFLKLGKKELLAKMGKFTKWLFSVKTTT